MPLTTNGDYAFLLHIIRSLKPAGKGAIILPHGVLYRGKVEATIRKEVIKRGYIKGIIGLPANLFYGTGIPACIIVLDKEHAQTRKGIFMIDASGCFIKDGNKNRLREQDIHKIVDVFNKGVKVKGFARMVPTAEIADPKNDYNLNLPRYIDSNKEEDIHNLTAHLNGGIPKRDIDQLQHYWDIFTNTRKTLFKQKPNSNYLTAQLESDQVKTAILESTEYKDYESKAKATLNKWQGKHATYLKSLNTESKPKEVIWQISESLLETFANTPLLDKYDIYQHLMNYWLETMQDDVYQISTDGWQQAAQIRLIVDAKGKDSKTKEIPDIVIGSKGKGQKFRAELIPPNLIIKRYYTNEQQTIDDLVIQQEAITQQIEELLEENSGEEGLLQGINSKKNAEERLQEILAEYFNESDEIRYLLKIKDYIDSKQPYDSLYQSLSVKTKESILNKNGKPGKQKIDAAIKEIKAQIQQTVKDEEAVLLKKYIDLEIQKKVKIDESKNLQQELNKNTAAHYAKLTVDEVKQLVVNDKWFAQLKLDVEAEVERVTQKLANRVKELEERYAHPMPTIAKKVDGYSVKVEEHLREMGLEW